MAVRNCYICFKQIGFKSPKHCLKIKEQNIIAPQAVFLYLGVFCQPTEKWRVTCTHQQVWKIVQLHFVWTTILFTRGKCFEDDDFVFDVGYFQIMFYKLKGKISDE